MLCPSAMASMRERKTGREMEKEIEREGGRDSRRLARRRLARRRLARRRCGRQAPRSAGRIASRTGRPSGSERVDRPDPNGSTVRKNRQSAESARIRRCRRQTARQAVRRRDAVRSFLRQAPQNERIERKRAQTSPSRRAGQAPRAARQAGPGAPSRGPRAPGPDGRTLPRISRRLAPNSGGAPAATRARPAAAPMPAGRPLGGGCIFFPSRDSGVVFSLRNRTKHHVNRTTLFPPSTTHCSSIRESLLACRRSMNPHCSSE